MQITSALVVATLAAGIAAAPVSRVDARGVNDNETGLLARGDHDDVDFEARSLVDNMEYGLWARAGPHGQGSNVADAVSMANAQLAAKRVADEEQRRTAALQKAKAQVAQQQAAQAAARPAPAPPTAFQQATGMFKNVKKQRSLEDFDDLDFEARSLDDDMEDGLWARAGPHGQGSNVADAVSMANAQLAAKRVADEEQRRTAALQKAKAQVAQQQAAQAAARPAPAPPTAFQQATGIFKNVKKQRSLDDSDDVDFEARSLDDDVEDGLWARAGPHGQGSNVADAVSMANAQLAANRRAEEEKRRTAALQKAKTQVAQQQAAARPAPAPETAFQQATGIFRNIRKQRSLEDSNDADFEARSLGGEMGHGLWARAGPHGQGSNVADAVSMANAQLAAKRVADEEQRRTAALQKAKAQVAQQQAAQAAARPAPAPQTAFQQATGMFKNVKKQRSLDDSDDVDFEARSFGDDMEDGLWARAGPHGQGSNVADAVSMANAQLAAKRVADEEQRRTAALQKAKAQVAQQQAAQAAARPAPAPQTAFQQATGMFKNVKKQRSLADFEDFDFEARSFDDFDGLDFEPRSLEDFDGYVFDSRSLEELD